MRIAYVLKDDDLKASVDIFAEALPAYARARNLDVAKARTRPEASPDFHLPAEG